MRRAVIMLIVVVFATRLAAQTTSTAAPAAAAPNSDLQNVDDFRRLFEERERLVEQLRELEKSIDDLNTKTRNLPAVETLERDLARSKRDLEKAEKAKVPDAAYIDSIQRYVETTTENLDIAKSSMPLLLTQRAEYDRAGRHLFALEQRIASLFDASRDVNKFRTNVTFTFGVLVFIVIVGNFT